MPELPEVEVTRRQLVPLLVGRRVARVVTSVPSYFFLTPPAVLRRKLKGRRFETIDESRNNPFTAFFAVGEGWHNNHHRYQRAARNGFYWWEFDPTYYVVAAMSWLGLAWNLQPVPARIYDEASRRAPGVVPGPPGAGA